MKKLLFLLDDDKNYSNDLSLLLHNYYDIINFSEPELFFGKLKSDSPDAILLDLMMPKISGLDVLLKIKEMEPDIPVIMITDFASIDTAIKAIKLGAFDYLSKTLKIDELRFILDKAFQEKIFKTHSDDLANEIAKQYSNIIGNSDSTKKLNETVWLYANNEATVLITGESGVGKELVARQIHLRSNRRNKPFVAINCPSIPSELIESELFGHEKGSFTGAINRKIGKFELANEGTLFLDEISEMNQELQVKLLRVLQEKEFERVGGNRTIKTNARIIAATNRNIEDYVEKGFFRNDLYYRLNVLQITIEPLRERNEDIKPLTIYFIKRISQELNKYNLSITDEAINELTKYQFPGNVRELYNILTRAAIIAKNELIELKDLSINQTQNGKTKTIAEKIPETLDELHELRHKAAMQASREIDKIFLDNLLNKFDGNISKAAQHIGISRINLHKMIKKVNDME